MKWLRSEWMMRALALLLFAALAIVVLSKPSEGREIFCAQQEGSADAVLLDKASPWGKVVVKLKVNDKLEVLDDKTSKTHIKVRTVDGKEGWIKRAASSLEVIVQAGDKGTAGVDSSKSGAAAKGLNSEIEADLKKSDPKYSERLRTIDTLEITTHEKLGGGNRVVMRKDVETGFTAAENYAVDSEKVRSAYTGFGVDGGLLKINP